MKRIAVVFMAVVLLTSGGLIYIAHSAKLVHASSCTDSCLYNQDPIAAGCSAQPPDGTHIGTRGGYLSYHEVIIYDQFGTELARFRNVYSSDCKTNWVWGKLTGGTRLKLKISEPYGSNNPLETACEPTDCTSYLSYAINAWSNMVDGTQVTNACAYTTSAEDHRDYNSCWQM